MYSFQYHRARSVDDAGRALNDNPDAKLLAGGMSLLPMMKLRLARASDIVDLCDVAGLSGLSVEDGALTIRAMTTHADVAASEVVRRAIPALAHLAGGIGDPHCRNRGTIGGSLAHADPAACYPSGVLSLGATIETNKRRIAADEFFHSAFETALEPAEIVASVSFPIPECACYVKFPQPASRFALCGVFVARTGGQARVAATGAAECAFRVPAIEEALSDAFVPDALDGIEVPQDGLGSDIYGDPEYRAHLVTVLARRAVEGCVQDTAGA